MTKNILVVTGTRAEYGILKGLLKKLVQDSNVNLHIIATAMHLEPKYGETYKAIEADGFTIDLKVSMGLTDTKNTTILNGMAVLMQQLSDYLAANTIDLIIILGDRYEMLSVANAAVLNRVPIAHLHGGELTLGNYDEFIRHAITKMSHLHLTSTEDYRRRVLQLGEQEATVLNSGSLGVENVADNLKTMEKSDLDFLNLAEHYGVVLFHPETLKDGDSPAKQVQTLLTALKSQQQQYIFIGSNSDTGSDDIMNAIRDYVNNDEFGSQMVASLSTKQYHTLVHFSDFLIGNSSSGIIEVPSLQVPTINLGDRQKGRVRGASVIDIRVDETQIINALQKARTPEFRQLAATSPNPYYQENAIENAYQFIMDNLNLGISIEKIFVDRNW